MASLKTVIHICFSSGVSARRGYVLVGVLKTNAFCPPPSSSGACSSTENPSETPPMIISPRGKASYTEIEIKNKCLINSFANILLQTYSGFFIVHQSLLV